MTTKIEMLTRQVSFEGATGVYQVADILGRALHNLIDQAAGARSNGIQWDTLEFHTKQRSYGDKYVELSVLHTKEI